MAKLYGVGIGPGDTGCITLAAAKLLNAADVIFAPAARIKDHSLAADIIASCGVDDSKIRELVFPMTKDTAALNAAWNKAAEPIIEAIDQNKTAAFITLGDPNVYSTWIYLRRAVASLRPDIVTESVPGIMAMNAAAAALNRGLVEGAQRLTLLPLPEPVSGLDVFLPLVDTLVVYKIGARLPELAEWVTDRGLVGGAGLVAGAGLARERSGPLVELAESAEGYLSVAIIPIPRMGIS